MDGITNFSDQLSIKDEISRGLNFESYGGSPMTGGCYVHPRVLKKKLHKIANRIAILQ